MYNTFDYYVTDIIHDKKITYNPNSDIGGSLYFKGEFEKRELELCSEYIRKDSIVIDIGANIGLHTIYFAQIADNGLVFSFEPSHETFRLLLKNVNNIPNVLPLNIGISDCTETTEFYITCDDAYSSLKDTKRKAIKSKQKVICYTIDDLLLKLNLTHIDFVKIDVEGLEQNVLEGMGAIIDKYSPVIFCEIYQGASSNDKPDETVNFLINKGYDAFIFDGESLIKYSRHDDRFYNYFFLPSKCIR